MRWALATRRLDMELRLGTRTNMIAVAKATSHHVADSPVLPELVTTAAENFIQHLIPTA